MIWPADAKDRRGQIVDIGHVSISSGWGRRVPLLIATIGCVAILLGTVGPEPDFGSCDRDEAVLAEFYVPDRGAIRQHIPGLAYTPEVEGEPILVNGVPAGLSEPGQLHVVVLKCLRYSQIPIIGLASPDGSLPENVPHVVIISTSTGDAWYFGDVSFTGLRP
jgi:hypothetical protein